MTSHSGRRRPKSSGTIKFGPRWTIPYFREGIEIDGKMVLSPPAPPPESPKVEVDGAVTIGWLRQRGYGLLVICTSCHHWRMCDAGALRDWVDLADDVPISEISEIGQPLQCDSCESDNVEVRPALATD